MNFRPVNSATGPDGALYICDMYRGIIQEGNWVRPGSYLRPVVEKYKLQDNIRRGRIYRVVHESYRKTKQPRMYDENGRPGQAPFPRQRLVENDRAKGDHPAAGRLSGVGIKKPREDRWYRACSRDVDT